VMSIGGRLGDDDDGETPNTQVVIHDYEKAPLFFETRGLPKGKECPAPALWGKNMDSPDWFPGGSGISGVGGFGHRPGYDGRGHVAAYDHDGKKMQEFEPIEGSGHMENFIAAVRSRKNEDLHAQCNETHLSSALCHTSMISHQIGRKSRPEEILEQM